MRPSYLCLATLLASTASTHALASSDAAAQNTTEAPATAQDSAADGAQEPAKKAFTTGVAKGRDLLDTAISASVLDDRELRTLSVSSVAGILQNIPGFRSETSDIDGFSAITIRGLPLAAEGSKWVQMQEDGLPVLEFGDIQFGAVDQFLRADLSVSQVQTIRGGSASTFASNSPGGVINFLSRTGEVEAGIVEISSGVGHDLKRIDFSYGAPISDEWRFHVGGFYREGEGPREIGYNGFRGGQIKANVTREFEGGYVRVYAKLLDDRQPNYALLPVSLSGTNDNAEVNSLPGFDITSEAYLSPLIASYPEIDRNNAPQTIDARNGIRGEARSIGLESKFDVAGWSVTNKFRFAAMGGEYNETLPFFFGPASNVSSAVAGPGAQAIYTAGPNAGQAITDDRFIGLTIRSHANLNDLDNTTNDLRASRVWEVGKGVLTTTAGLYNSNQSIDMSWNFTSTLNDLAGGGDIAPLDLVTATGVPVSDNSVLAYGFTSALPLEAFHNSYNLEYDILAPYGSLNYKIGKLALGASMRWDNGSVEGDVFSPEFGGNRVASAAIDVNGNSTISLPESAVPVYPIGQPAVVDYDYDYLSFSVSANYRVSEPFSVFARYSQGGRANGESAVGANSLNLATGRPVDAIGLFTRVEQAEVGAKYRVNDFSFFVTGFWAATEERNFQIAGDDQGQAFIQDVERDYSAEGIEIEGNYARGPFSLSLGATFTNAHIDSDNIDETLVGNTPRHIPDAVFFARPEVIFDNFGFGTVINGTTDSFAQDGNVLVQPGYVLVSPFVTYKPADNLTVALNAFNAFDTKAIVQLQAAAIPPSGLTNAQVMNGRTVTASVRFNF